MRLNQLFHVENNVWQPLILIHIWTKIDYGFVQLNKGWYCIAHTAKAESGKQRQQSSTTLYLICQNISFVFIFECLLDGIVRIPHLPFSDLHRAVPKSLPPSLLLQLKHLGSLLS